MAKLAAVNTVRVVRDIREASFLLDVPSASLRDAILTATNDAGFMTRPAWEPLHNLPMYSDVPRDDLSG